MTGTGGPISGWPASTLRCPGRGAEAEVELGKALELDPVAPGASELLLQVLESEAKFDRVQEEIAEASPDVTRLDASLLVRSAQLYERTGEWDKAAARWKQASEAAPRVAQWHIEYARVLDRLGRKDEALAEANRAAEIGPPSVQTARAQISAYLSCGDRAKAEQVLLDTIKALPDDPTVYHPGGPGLSRPLARRPRRNRCSSN